MDSTQKFAFAQISKQKKSLLSGDLDISLNNIMNSESFQTILSECREYRNRIYTPLKTVFIFIKQVLSSDKSCKQAVTKAAVEQLVAGAPEISINTGPYCKARQRLPESTIKALVNETGGSASRKSLKSWKFFNREVKLIDGLSCSAPDTEALQAEYPQHAGQAIGCGFPLMRLVVVMSLTVGTVINYAIGKYKGKGTGEHSLLREIFDTSINKDDIVLGDRYYPSYFLMADLKAKGADGIFQGHRSRKCDFRAGKRLGSKDHVVTWSKPAKPLWMEQATYDIYPETIEIREFKIAGRIIITTLLDCKKYTKKVLATIYLSRWQVEINIKSIKDIMGMNILSCKTPEMVRKEIGIHFLAYNIIRIIMAEACSKYGSNPNCVSFKGTIQLLNACMPYFIQGQISNDVLYDFMLRSLVKNKVGNRPGRCEPRVVKRRSKPFRTLKKPRHIEKERLISKMEKIRQQFDACA